MDKPELVSNIQKLVPQLSLERIKELANIELNRQLEDIATGMLHKKSIETLRAVIDYVPAPPQPTQQPTNLPLTVKRKR